MFKGAIISAVVRCSALAGALLLIGCATTPSTTRHPEIEAEIRSARNLEADDGISKETRARQLFVRALTQAQVGDHEAALDLYTQALHLAPNTPAILAASAESHEALGDETSALYNARKAVEMEPGNVHYHFQLAQLYLSSGDTRRAADVYRNLRQRFPENLEVLYELARVYTMTGEYAEAVGAYEQLLDEIGDDRDIQNEILHLFVRMGDVEGMERVLTELIDDHPHDAQFHRMLGDVYLKQGREEEAAEQMKAALDANPTDVETLLSLTDLYRSIDKPDSADALLERAANLEGATPSQLLTQAAPLYARAREDEDARRTVEQILERALEMDPSNADALMMLGDLRLTAERFGEAGDLLYRALGSNPRDPHLWMQAAGAYLQAGNLEKAIDVADEGLLLFPGSLPLLRLAAYALMDSYKNREAIRRFEQAIEIIREDSTEAETDLSALYAALGLLYSRTKDLENSDRAYEQAVEIDPSNAAALNNFAYSLAGRARQLDRALELAARAVEISPGVASFLDTLGWIHFQREEYREALIWVQKAADTGEASATVYEHLGDVHDALGNARQASESWQKALEMNPESSVLREKLHQE